MRLVLAFSVLVFFCSSLSAEEIKVINIPDFSELAKEQSKIVVSIEVSYRKEIDRDNPLDFFGNELAKGTGSGFVIDKDKGYIITNYHVIKEADEILVRTNSKKKYKAVLLGGDEYSDIALLQVKEASLPAAAKIINNDRAIKPGEWVFAVGSPFGLDYTITAGIISAINRDLGSTFTPFIQTDTVINPGSSGGPLFNIYGEVIGITSQIYSRSGAYQGISFAIPMSYANTIIAELIKNGKVKRGYIGVQIQAMTELEKGVLVGDVESGSPAEIAGIKRGDIIVEFDGNEISSTADLPRLVARAEIGTKKSMKIIRDEDEEKQLEVIIGEPKVATSEISKLLLGIEIRELKPEEAVKGKYDKGVVIISSGAGKASRILTAGMVIVKVNQSSITSVAEFEEAIKAIPEGKVFSLLVFNEGTPIFLSMKK